MATKGQAKPSSSSASAECVKVMIRVRPMNASETAKSIHVNNEQHQITLKRPKDAKEPPKSFTFDSVFNTEATQRFIYEESAFPLIESVLEGYNGTIFAYGQTGCGKTFTMVGAGGDLKGIIPNSFAHIFDSISAHGKEKRFLLRCSYLEIYNESIHDLLEYSPDKKLELKEDPQKGIYIKGLANVIVKSVADIEQTMTKGTSNRHTAETGMNKDSSRSHCIFTIYIETAETKQDGNELLKAGKLNLVDLAGSERQAKTHAEGIRLKEASKINLSLSALGNVISALVDGKSSHVPYRDSKLTRLLQDSLGGNTKTVMIACVSPADYNYDETLSTLRYASRAKNIQNKPHINEDPKDALLRKYEEEIKDLKEMLERLAKGGMPIEQLKEMEIARKSMIEGDPTKLIEQLKEENPGIDDEKLRQLEEEKALLHKDKEKIENELKEREAQFITEKVQREKLESMLKEVEQKLLCGGSEFEERQKEQTKKYRDMQQKLKKQLQKEKKLRVEQQRKEAEMLMFEKQYKDVQEELKDKDDILQNIREKYEAALSEVKDLQREHQDEKEMLLDTIREQNQEVEFYKKVVEIMMSEGELEKIKNKATWDDESNTWSIPLFVVQNKQVMLPKLPKTQVTELIENEKKNRVINFVAQERNTTITRQSKVTKSQQIMTSAPNGEGKHLSGKDIPVHQSTVYANTKREQSEKSSSRHLFNWELLNKGKYSGFDKPLKGDSPPKKTKNVRLEALQYNPAANLAPVNEEDLKQKEPQPQTNVIKKPKVLAKIDESLLTNAAKAHQQQNIEYLLAGIGDRPKEPVKGPSKHRGPLPKVPFAKHDDN